MKQQLVYTSLATIVLAASVHAAPPPTLSRPKSPPTVTAITTVACDNQPGISDDVTLTAFDIEKIKVRYPEVHSPSTAAAMNEQLRKDFTATKANDNHMRAAYRAYKPIAASPQTGTPAGALSAQLNTPSGFLPTLPLEARLDLLAKIKRASEVHAQQQQQKLTLRQRVIIAAALATAAGALPKQVAK